MKKYKENTGIVLVTILLMLIIMVMLTIALVAVNSNNLNYSLNYYNRVAALEAAESGIAYSIYSLQIDPGWNPDEFLHNTDTGKFTINFKPVDYFSFNNLTGKTDLNKAGYGGETVYKNTVDLIVSGYSGNVVKRVRVIIGLPSISDVARITGKANIKAGIFDISSVSSSDDKRGYFHSNSPDDDAIVSSSTSQVNAYGGTISAVGKVNITSYDASNGTELKNNAHARLVPSINIKGIVSEASTRAGIAKMNGGTYIIQKHTDGNYKLFKLSNLNSPVAPPDGATIDPSTGTFTITKDVYIDGDVTFAFKRNSDYGSAKIKLEPEETDKPYPKIYVNGTSENKSFWVIGKVEGNGSIITGGGSEFIMETSVTGQADPGVALLSEKDIDIKLPASRISSINLSLQGAVVSHGDMNVSIMDPNDPDNPSKALGGILGWDDNWVEQSFDNVESSGGGQSTAWRFPMETILIGPGGVKFDDPNPPAGLNKVTWIFGGSSGLWPVDDPRRGEIFKNPDGTYTFNGGENHSSYPQTEYQNRILVSYSGPAGYGSQVLVNRVGHNTINFNGSEGTIPVASQKIKDLFGGEAGVYAHLYNSMNNYNFEGDPRIKPVEKTTMADTPYPPNVTIIGGLMIADPNGLDITGNMFVDNSNGRFNLVQSKAYETILASPEFGRQLVVRTWELLH